MTKVRFTIDADRRAIVKFTPITFRGEGTVILADIRKSQIVVDHEEIPGFMAPMIIREASKAASRPQAKRKDSLYYRCQGEDHR